MSKDRTLSERIEDALAVTIFLLIAAATLAVTIFLFMASFNVETPAPPVEPAPEPCVVTTGVWSEHYAEIFQPTTTYDPSLGGLSAYLAALTEA